MKILHTADWHLGMRQFDRVAPNGVNQREVDILQTASAAVDLMIAQRPDILVIGGDVFHVSRPSNNTIVLAFSLFLRLRKALPNTPIVIVSGNHDAPKTADAGNILPLFRKLGNVHVIENAAEWLAFPELQLDLLCVPDVIGLQRPELRPRDASVKHRVLLMHGEIAGVMPIALPHDIPLADLHGDEWSYVALGHYHVYREVAPRVYYSGSLDYTSSDPWGEMREQQARGVPGKGFVVHDLMSGSHEFIPVPPARAWVELPSIDAQLKTSSELDAAIGSAVASVPGGIEGKVVRTVLRNMPRHRLRELNQQAIRDYRLEAHHFQLDTRAPEARAFQVDVSTPERRRSLEDRVAEFLEAYPMSADLDRKAFVANGVQYLRRVVDTTPTATLEAA